FGQATRIARLVIRRRGAERQERQLRHRELQLRTDVEARQALIVRLPRRRLDVRQAHVLRAAGEEQWRAAAEERCRPATVGEAWRAADGGGVVLRGVEGLGAIEGRADAVVPPVATEVTTVGARALRGGIEILLILLLHRQVREVIDVAARREPAAQM